MRMPMEADSEVKGPNLTPVIDVVFLLLVFFLVAMKFSEEEKLVSIRLAEVLEARPLAAGPRELIVNITDKGEFVIGTETLQESELIDFLHQAAVKNPGGQTVQIRADQDVKFKFPLTVIGICKQEEIEYSCTVLEKKNPNS